MTAPSAAQRLPPGYWRLLTASGISNLGDGIFIAALPLLAARLADDAVGVSLVAAAAVLPWLVFSLPIGAIIDRYDRRQIMILTDSLRAVLVGVLAVAVAGPAPTVLTGTAATASGRCPAVLPFFVLPFDLPMLTPAPGWGMLQRNMHLIWAADPAGQGVFVRRNIASAIYLSIY